MHDQLPETAGSTAVVISSLEGMGGVGKTRLAVHRAHQLLAGGRYADVQLYVDLRGHADQPPADPAAVLASFLRLLGVPGGQIPQDLPSRSAMFRDQLFGKNALVLLDNAAGEDQVLPLLPASSSNLVLITSRRSLALDGAHTLPLDVMGRLDEARELLERLVADAVEHGPVPNEAAARHRLGKTYWALGRLDDALGLVRTAGGFTESEVLVDLGVVHRDAGRLDVALDMIGEAMTLAVTTKERYQQARALDALAGVHDRAGHADLAEDHWRRAYALFTELGTPEADRIRPRLRSDTASPAARGAG